MLEPLTHRTDLGHDMEIVLFVLLLILLVLAIVYFARRV